MQLARAFCVCIVAVLCIQYTYVSAGSFLDGGSTGDDNSYHLNGTASRSKLVAGQFCSKPNFTDPMLEVRLYVFENDQSFNHTDGPNAGKPVTWEQCQFVDVAQFRSSVKSRQHGTNCNLTRIDSSFGPNGISVDDVDERTLSTQFSFNADSGPVPCGGLQNGLEFTFIIECYRNELFQKHFDAYFEFTCNNGTALSRTLTNSTIISNPKVVNNTIRNEVDMKCYHVKNMTTYFDMSIEKTVVVPGEIEEPSATGIPLGSSMFCEWCIAIDSGRGDTRHYFGEKDVKGLTVEYLMVENIESENQVVTGFPRSVKVLEKNCGMGKEPASQFLNDSIPDIIYRTVNEVTKDYITSPNCFRTSIFEVVRFTNKDIGLAAINITAKLKYCQDTTTTNGINECFGDLSTTSDATDGFTNCTGVTGALPGRRRRATDEDEYPEFTAVTILISNGEEEQQPTDNNQQVEEETEKCFEKDTFTILTACLAFLLAVVMMMSIFLACKIQSVRRDEKESSQSGFTNKGYY